MQINEAVENAIKLSQTTLRKSNIALNLQLGQDLPLLEGNKQSIEQIVLNLIVNSIQAINHNSGQINIITEFRKEKNQIIVSISDNGKGIDPSISKKIFDPFITDKQTEGGTGLGLSVTYNLVIAHSGKITFKSEKEKGTTFTVSIPIRQDEIAVKILLVDDEEDFREALKEILAKRQSLLVEDAENGIEACIKLGSFRPDLLILDINMPKMDGLEVCRAIRKDPNLSSVKVMIITGHPNDPRLKQVAELGFHYIYTKPLSSADFLKEIDNILLQPTRVMI
jgi:CheY-like chemotaxis protein/anti-sigma regulatory factor (Ser/Thr protein kinase)